MAASDGTIRQGSPTNLARLYEEGAALQLIQQQEAEQERLEAQRKLGYASNQGILSLDGGRFLDNLALAVKYDGGKW